jgi:hypothetical protein
VFSTSSKKFKSEEVKMITAESIYMPDELTATTTELLISVSTDSDLYTQKGSAALNVSFNIFFAALNVTQQVNMIISGVEQALSRR